MIMTELFLGNTVKLKRFKELSSSAVNMFYFFSFNPYGTVKLILTKLKNLWISSLLHSPESAIANLQFAFINYFLKI